VAATGRSIGRFQNLLVVWLLDLVSDRNICEFQLLLFGYGQHLHRVASDRFVSLVGSFVSTEVVSPIGEFREFLGDLAEGPFLTDFEAN